MGAAFTEAPVGMALLSPSGAILDSNPRLAWLFATTRTRLRGRPLAGLLAPEGRQRFREGLDGLARGGATSFQVESLCAAGRAGAIWAHISAAILDGESGHAHFVVVFEDITQSRADEEALRRRTAVLVEVVRSQQELAAAGLSFDGVAALVLKGVQRLTGSDGAAVGLGEAGNRLHMHSASGSMRRLLGTRAGLTAGAWQTLSLGRPVLVHDRLDRSRGAVVTGLGRVHRSLVLVPLDHRGRGLAVVCASSRRAEAFTPEDVAALHLLSGLIGSALANSLDSQEHQDLLERLAMVTRTCPVAILAYDRRGIITFADGAAMPPPLKAGRLLGRSASDVYGEHPELEAAVHAALDGRPHLAAVYLHAQDRTFEIRHRPVFDASGDVVGASGIAVDVTDRVEAERAREESAAKSRFLATMSHELRTPLNSVIGFSQLLRSREFGNMSARQDRYVANIQAGGQHLLTLIEDLLDIGRIQAGELDVARQPVEVHTLLEEAIAGLRPQALQLGLTLTVSGESELWAEADPRRLHQIVINLLANGLKHTPRGGSICLSARGEPGTVCISVADTGTGIAEDQLERIFDEFTQVHGAAPSNRQEGSGLGLALCRRLAGLMGGSVAVESRLGNGSTFTVRLPAARQGH